MINCCRKRHMAKGETPTAMFVAIDVSIIIIALVMHFFNKLRH